MSGDDLSAWMTEHDYSQTRLAHALGVDMATIWRWRNGKSPIPPYLHLALIGLLSPHTEHGVTVHTAASSS